MCRGGSTEDRCEAEAMDETTVNALDTVSTVHYLLDKLINLNTRASGLSHFNIKGDKLDPNGTNPGLFQIRFQYILARGAKMY